MCSRHLLKNAKSGIKMNIVAEVHHRVIVTNQTLIPRQRRRRVSDYRLYDFVSSGRFGIETYRTLDLAGLNSLRMLRENYMYIVCALKILHVLVDVFLIGCLLLVEWCYDWIDFVCIIVSVPNIFISYYVCYSLINFVYRLIAVLFSATYG